MKSLDLHGIKHSDAEEMVDLFIGRYFNRLPVKIVTGNSIDMQCIVRKIIQSYGLKMVSTNHINLGSYIISHDLNK